MNILHIKSSILSKIVTLVIISVTILANIPAVTIFAADEDDPSKAIITLIITDESGNGYNFKTNSGTVVGTPQYSNGNLTSISYDRYGESLTEISFTISAKNGVLDFSTCTVGGTDYNTLKNEPSSSSGWKIKEDETNLIVVSNAVNDDGYLQVLTNTKIYLTIKAGTADDGSTALATENITEVVGKFRSGNATVKRVSNKQEGYWASAKVAIAEFQDTIEFVTNTFLSIAIIVSMMILIINIIKYASTETHPIKRVTSMKSFLTSLVCIAILGGVWFFSRLIIYLAI